MDMEDHSIQFRTAFARAIATQNASVLASHLGVSDDIQGSRSIYLSSHQQLGGHAAILWRHVS
jgi:hypothetical protein